MANAASILDEFDEKLSQCSICFEEYKNPRQLPCNHRYCKECLVQLIRDRGAVRSFKCPICQRKTKIPKLGIDAFPPPEGEEELEVELSDQTGRDGTEGSACQHGGSNSCETSAPLATEQSQKKLQDVIDITSEEEICINIPGITSEGWYIRGIACTKSGTIVVTGGAQTHKGHITVTNWGGETVHQRVLVSRGSVLTSTACYCVRFQHSKIATVLDPDEVGLFDVNSYTYYKKRLKEDVKVWPSGRGLRSITADDENDLLIMGCYKGRDLYVVDEQLNLQNTIRLPGVIKWPFDICYTDGSIIICDRDGRRACAINMEGDLLYEFIKPEPYKCPEAVSACVDKNGFIYILWKETWYKQEQDCVFAQYSRDGRRLLAKRELYSDAGWITTAEIEVPPRGMQEKLLIATWASGRMHVFGLVSLKAIIPVPKPKKKLSWNSS